MLRVVGSVALMFILSSPVWLSMVVFATIEGRQVWHLIGQMFIVCVGLGVAGEVADKYFFRGKE